MKNKLFKRGLGVVLFLLCACSITFAQTNVTLSGAIRDKSSGNAMAGVTVAIKGGRAGTVSNNNGSFQLKTVQTFPLTLVFSYVGYKTEERTLSSASTDLQIELTPTEVLGQEVVVAASRIQESILQSPVSIEKLDSRALKASPAPSFYDALGNLKGVEMSAQSLTFKSVNTRGFNSNGNTRVLQLNDGMDNQAPGLNFSVGNMVGIPELDLDNVELLPGAASALYGPNALNGIVLMNSKNPFQYQGLSAQVKTGILNDNGRTTATTGFYDVSVRYAQAFNNRFAFKLNIGYLQAKDWQAYDHRDQSLANGHTLADGTRANNEGYNGVNIYGDENSANIYSSLALQAANPASALSQQLQAVAAKLNNLVTPAQILGAAIPNMDVTRTGYNEADVVDYNTKNLKLNGALHYKIKEDLEALIQGSYGYGTTVYTGADRYSLRNFNMGQYKAEIKSPDFYVRLYTTQERSGDSYAGGTLAAGINEAWKPSRTQWFPEYFSTYAGLAILDFANTYGAALQSGKTPDEAMAAAKAKLDASRGGYTSAARAKAETGRLLPGTPEFDAAAEKVKNKAIPGDASGVGAKFTDKTNLYQAEFMYNFHKLIHFAEILVGGNYRRYALNSEKTLFAVDDNGNEFRINEYGGYLQVMKKVADEHLKLTGSIRYDKNMNFKGQFSPRLSAVYTFLNTHNIRISYQTGFRIPHNQDQYIDLVTPQAHLLGGLPFLRERYGLNNGPVYTLQSYLAGHPEQYTFREFLPERIQAYEIGYKALIAQRLLIDAYIYKNDFKNMNGTQVLVKPTADPSNPDIYSIPVSATETVKSWGWALGVDYSLPANFTAGGNISYNELSNASSLGSFLAMYNTPKVRYSLNFGNRNIANSNFAFNILWKWQQSFIWQSSFVGPKVNALALSEIPAFGTLDAMVSKFFPKAKTTVKLGGVNILNKKVIQSWGNPTMGSQWYISLGYNL
ncbi:TonB-dependent Receptor Plug Domain [Chitinophaga terrae (ex Kim and Jung 2007)]|uniref:TonB-dependent Receptor Plug Domain n=1 Tax=Chitinophaga terrae (ex Kim and Jung 2007) TaxID=408074 RepID=A0A1H4CBQ4_9BACT|nr:TonB-dependent receptor [Chitinophaga terrae (ex Kim and Jung 2007)]MDQ0110074.1 outer membrane receptor protein involved in Fe transport [Chitinophaga terrae (ex Kim and Jung 2007)]GEP88870.1 membrane protein [Chitinophaga terrae (ex Kim and Jung 2007)]SEA57743.1 TonB-dependent Receptor Plug Domain [Chitinophaga terrae (ex Kim and Jung 2007)]